MCRVRDVCDANQRYKHYFCAAGFYFAKCLACCLHGCKPIEKEREGDAVIAWPTATPSGRNSQASADLDSRLDAVEKAQAFMASKNAAGGGEWVDPVPFDFSDVSGLAGTSATSWKRPRTFLFTFGIFSPISYDSILNYLYNDF